MTATGVAAFDCTDTGAGPALVFLPGSYSTVAAWRPVQHALLPVVEGSPNPHARQDGGRT